MNKPFFVHINPHHPGKYLNAKQSRGATLYVVPRADQQCEVGVAYCSPRDNFNKKTGRAVAQAAERSIINKRQLPSFAAEIRNKTYEYGCYPASFYDYLLRNFL